MALGDPERDGVISLYGGWELYKKACSIDPARVVRNEILTRKVPAHSIDFRMLDFRHFDVEDDTTDMALFTVFLFHWPVIHILECSAFDYGEKY